MNILLALVLTVNVLITAILVVSILEIRSVYRRLRAQFTQFVSPTAEGKPSPLAETAQAVSDVLARTLIAHAKTTLMGIQSGDVRAEKSIQADIAQDMLTQKSPFIAALLSSFPTLSKTLRRNPQLIDAAINMLGNKLPKVADNGSNGSKDLQAQFKL